MTKPKTAQESVRVGQVWIDQDSRLADGGLRRLEVTKVAGLKVTLKNLTTGRLTTITKANLRPVGSSRGYRLEE